MPDPPPQRLSRLRGALANLLVLAFGVFLALGLGELLVRLTVGNPPDLLDKSDPVLGSRYLAGRRAVRVVDGRRAEVVINSLGFHSPEHPFDRPQGTRRLVFLGDSFTGATEVTLAQTFHQQAAGLLSARLHQPVESVSLGVSGYGNGTELIVWRTIGQRYESDVVVLMLFVGNDVHDNEPGLNGGRVPTFTVSPDGRLVAAPFHARWTKKRSWIRDSALYKWQKGVTNRAIEHFLQSQDLLPRYGVYQAPDTAAWQNAWRITEGILTTLAAEVKASGRRLLVVLIPEDLQVNDADWQAVLQRYPKMRQRQWDLGYPQRRLVAFGRQEGLEVLDPQEAFRAAMTRQRLYNVEDPHFSPAGHTFLADLLADRLLELGWLAAAAPTSAATEPGRP